MFFFYQIIISLLLIISPLIIFYRILKNKEDIKSIKEKFCLPTKSRKSGRIIWFHGASVGEIMSVVPIIKKGIFFRIILLLIFSSLKNNIERAATSITEANIIKIN